MIGIPSQGFFAATAPPSTRTMRSASTGRIGTQSSKGLNFMQIFLSRLKPIALTVRRSKFGKIPPAIRLALYVRERY